MKLKKHRYGLMIGNGKVWYKLSVRGFLRLLAHYKLKRFFKTILITILILLVLYFVWNVLQDRYIK